MWTMRDERGEADRVEKIETLETATIQAERMAEYERVQDEMMWQTTGGEGDYDSFGPSQATGL